MLTERPLLARASWGAIVPLVGLAAGLAMVAGVFRAQTIVSDAFDPYYFGEMGKSLARGEGLERYGTLLRRRSPLYPFMIGALYRLFGEHPLSVQLLQCVLLAATCWLVYDMGRRVFSATSGAMAGIACGLHPLMLRYVADFHLETLLTCLFTLTVWCTVRFYFKPSVINGVILGIAGAAAALTKAVVILYPPLFVGMWLLIRSVEERERRRAGPPLAAIAAIALSMIVVIAPWTIRNYRVTHGKFVLISTGFSDAFLRGYVFSEADYALLRRPPYTDAENASNAWFESIARAAGTQWQRDDYETEQVLAQEAKRKLAAEPGEFVRKSVVGLFTFWYEMTSLANSLLVGVLALLAWIFALAGLRRSLDEGRPIWLFLLPAIHLNLILAVLLALGRYSAPVVPALLVASAFGAETVLFSLRRSGKEPRRS